MITTIINDCRDANAQGRQISRAALLLESHINFIGITNELEASGNLIDTLDATEGQESIILVNVAPRHGEAKKWKNGTPFGYFWYKKTLIVSSIDGLVLSLAKKFGLTEAVKVMDIPTVANILTDKNFITSDLKEYIINTQFRSFDFLPRIGAYLLKNKEIENTTEKISNFPETPPAIWFIDNFGNCKTTILKDEVEITENNTVKTLLGELPIFTRLADVPNKTTALVVGSSGLGNKRFLEIMTQGDNTSKKFNLNLGDLVI